jgi:soluble lytic murein transglycosylase
MPAVLLLVAVGLVAVLVVRGPDWVGRLSHPLRYETTIAEQSKANHVDPYLIAGLIDTESGFREGVVSDAGAVGLMQIKPSTAVAVARDAGITDKMTTAALSVPDTNIRVGTKYFAYLVRRYGGDVQLGLAAYNAGLGNADRWAAEAQRLHRPFSESIAFPETARYVENVLAQQKAYRGLYPNAFAASSK